MKSYFIKAAQISEKIVRFYASWLPLKIDGVTGGFNFQNAWTGAYLAAQELSK